MQKLSLMLCFENPDKLVYRLKHFEVKDNGIAYLYLDLVCGYDYIDPDTHNMQGYVDKSNFVKDVQQDIVSVDLFKENFIEALENERYKVFSTLPKIFRKDLLNEKRNEA